MHIAKNPQVSDQTIPKRKECCASPLDLLPCWPETEEVSAMHSRETHSGKTLLALFNQVKNVTLVCTKGLMNEIDIFGKLGMPILARAEGASEREIRLQQQGNRRLVVLVPHVIVELMNNRLERRCLHG